MKRKKSVIVQSDSFAGLTNHVSTRSDQHSEEEIERVIMKPDERRRFDHDSVMDLVVRSARTDASEMVCLESTEPPRSPTDVRAKQLRVNVKLHHVLERSVVDPLASFWGNTLEQTSTQRKRSALTVMMILSGSKQVLSLSVYAVDVSCVS